jgi:hypothetical protein
LRLAPSALLFIFILLDTNKEQQFYLYFIVDTNKEGCCAVAPPPSLFLSYTNKDKKGAGSNFYLTKMLRRKDTKVDTNKEGCLLR